MTRRLRLLRQSPDDITTNASQSRKNGLILANGGMLTYQHVIVLSTHPRIDNSSYPVSNPLPEELTPDVLKSIPSAIKLPPTITSPPEVEEKANGPAVIESYTVEFGRDGKPMRGHVVGRLTEKGNTEGHRFIANHGDERTLEELASHSREPIGRTGWVKCEEGTDINLFTFGAERSAVL